MGHLSQQSKAPTSESFGSPRRLLCLLYERCDCTPLLLEDHTTTDIAQGWVANSPSPMPSDAAESATLVSACARNDASPTFETTGDPLLLIGRRGGRRLQDDRVVSFDLDSFQ